MVNPLRGVSSWRAKWQWAVIVEVNLNGSVVFVQEGDGELSSIYQTSVATLSIPFIASKVIQS
jgi:hypothetical protein